MDRERYEKEAQALIRNRVTALRALTFAQATALPEARGEDVMVAGHKCALTTFRQSLRPDETLVTIQVARPALLGIATTHTEHGLVFNQGGSVRDASEEELRTSGG